MKEITDDEDRVTIGVYKRSFNLFLLAVYRLIATNEKTPRQRDQQDWIMELREQSHSLLSGPLGEPMNEAEKQDVYQMIRRITALTQDQQEQN